MDAMEQHRNIIVELGRLTKPSVYMLGGKINQYSMSVCGIHTIQEVQRMNFDQAFMGVTSYCDQAGFNCGVDEEAILKKTVMQQAEQVILLMDSSKIGVKNTYSFCNLSDVDIVISDDNLPEEFLEDCKRRGVQVI